MLHKSPCHKFANPQCSVQPPTGAGNFKDGMSKHGSERPCNRSPWSLVRVIYRTGMSKRGSMRPCKRSPGSPTSASVEQGEAHILQPHAPALLTSSLSAWVFKSHGPLSKQEAGRLWHNTALLAPPDTNTANHNAVQKHSAASTNAACYSLLSQRDIDSTGNRLHLASQQIKPHFRSQSLLPVRKDGTHIFWCSISSTVRKQP